MLNGEGSCAAPAHAACPGAAPRLLPGARLGAGGAERGCAGERKWAAWQAGLPCSAASSSAVSGLPCGSEASAHPACTACTCQYSSHAMFISFSSACKRMQAPPQTAPFHCRKRAMLHALIRPLSEILSCYKPTIIRASIASHTTHRTRDVQLEPRLLWAGRDSLRGHRSRRLLHNLPAACPAHAQCKHTAR